MPYVSTAMDTSERHGSLPRWEQLLLGLELGSGGPARDRLVDSAVFAFAVFAAACTAITHPHELVALNVALSIPACLALLARRRHPVTVAWLTVALSAVSSASVHAAQLAIF